MKKYLLAVAAAILTASAMPAHAQVRITEVAPWGSGNAPYAADWFELTNTGAVALTITGWTMDDASNNPNSALLSGITSIAPGESVIFLELTTGTATDLINSFLSTWFGGSVPVGLQVGTYTEGAAGGVGLGTSGDSVNVFNGTAGTLQANVVFGASDGVPPYQTFDNAARLNNTTISQLSIAGVNGAFVAANDVNEIGSPGAIPEPQTYAMMLAGLAVLGALTRKRRR